MSTGSWFWAIAAFVVEVAMLTVSGVAAFRLARPVGLSWAIVATLVALGVLVAFWGAWMAPSSAHRLALWPRVAVACGIVLVTAAGLAATGAPRTAVAYAGIGCLVMAIAQPVINPTQ